MIGDSDMAYDPLTEVVDEPLAIDQSTLDRLLIFKVADKLTDLPGADTGAERARLSAILNQLADRLIAGIAANPGKLWVLTEFQRALELVAQEDTEAREHFGTALEALMDIVGIESSDGLLSAYLGGI